jgi:hypothetical protein
MTDPTPPPSPAPAPPVTAASSIWHAIYDELKTLTLGFALGVAMVGWHMVPVPAPSPVPPIPSPIPGPPAPLPPPPVPPPVPSWGPLDKILILYESSKLTGKESFFSLPVRDALNQASPPDATTRTPGWRIWDQNVDATAEPKWADALAKAKVAFTTPADPVLFAFDAQGRMKTVPLKGQSDAATAAAIKALGGK